jgi:hypothetical protein
MKAENVFMEFPLDGAGKKDEQTFTIASGLACIRTDMVVVRQALALWPVATSGEISTAEPGTRKMASPVCRTLVPLGGRAAVRGSPKPHNRSCQDACKDEFEFDKGTNEEGLDQAVAGNAPGCGGRTDARVDLVLLRRRAAASADYRSGNSGRHGH